METLVAVPHHRNHYHHYHHHYGGGRRKSSVANRIGSSPNGGGFEGINCRAFQSTPGILPSPPVFAEPCSPRFRSEPRKPTKRSNPIAISPKPSSPKPNFVVDMEEFSRSELWAGPTYSNSPPPSSLPIPKVSLLQKRSVSLDAMPLSPSGSEVAITPISKSAPSSRTGDFVSSATENLRRILHLDVADD